MNRVCFIIVSIIDTSSDLIADDINSVTNITCLVFATCIHSIQCLISQTMSNVVNQMNLKAMNNNLDKLLIFDATINILF